MRKRRLYVYVAGPYSADPVVCTQRAIDAGVRLLDAGLAPFIPHLSHFIHVNHPRSYEVWMDLDLAWLRNCDVLLRLPGDSPGAEREVLLAHQLGMPVCHSVEELLALCGRKEAA